MDQNLELIIILELGNPDFNAFSLDFNATV